MLRYVSHPEVVMDPAIPVPEWVLSDTGRARVEALARRPWVATLTRVITSSEPKAIETAEILAGAAQQALVVEVRSSTAEIDRSSTGYLSHEDHETHANLLFAAPESSANGWERAIDAQRRMVVALEDLLEEPDATVVVGHGGVGTLWWCHLAGIEIARRHDQRRGGCLYAVDPVDSRPTSAWVEFEDDLT